MTNLTAWMDAHTGVSSWVQAFAVILTLALSFVVSRRDRSDRKAEASARARNAGIAILPLLRDVYAEIEWTLMRMSEGGNPDYLGRNGPDVDDVASLWSINALPQALKDLRGAMADLGPAAATTQKAYFALQGLDEDKQCFWYAREGEGSDMRGASADEMAKTLALLKACRGRINEAIGAIAKLLK